MKIHNPYDDNGAQCGACWKYYPWTKINVGSCGLTMCDNCAGRDYVYEYRKLHGLIAPREYNP